MLLEIFDPDLFQKYQGYNIMSLIGEYFENMFTSDGIIFLPRSIFA